MLESKIEAYLTKQARANGGRSLKWVCPGWAGVPDRILVFPGGRLAFAETKAPGKKERPQQVRRAEQLRALGFTVYSSVDSYEKIDRIIAEMTATH